MTTQTIDKSAIRKALRKALQPSRNANYNRQHWPQWLCDRLTTLAIYGYTDKCRLPLTTREALMRYSNGQTYDVIAVNMGIEKRSAERYILAALNWIIDNTPVNLLCNVPEIHTKWRLKGCRYCNGDLLWDDTESLYWCIQCARFDK